MSIDIWCTLIVQLNKENEERMNKKDLRKLTNQQLDKLLDEADWCDRDLLREHDERLFDGRIKTSAILRTKEEIEEFFRKRRKERQLQQKKKAG